MFEISVGLDRENRVNGRILQGLQPPGGQDHLAEVDIDNNNKGEKVMHRITQPPGGNSSNILDLQEENGNKIKPYRMASSFVLGDEQPDNNNTKSWDIQTGTRNTLFGPPSPTLSKAEKARINASKQTDYSIKPSKKPFPVNPLTGDILGQPGLKSPEPPRRQSTILPVSPLTGYTLGQPGMKEPEPPRR